MSTALSDFIKQTIHECGPVTFHWFMQQALYHPEWGYYTSGRARIGRSGDFYTNVSVGKLYGELMAKQFEEMWQRLGAPVEFTIIEEGAHDGQFAFDVLTCVQTTAPDFFKALRYVIIEPFAANQERQRERLGMLSDTNLGWFQNHEALQNAALDGVHFSNELIDAFPVHLVQCAHNRWLEMHVDWEQDQFVLKPEKLSSARLEKHLQDAVPLPPISAQPYQTEVNLEALDWIQNVAKILRRGFVLAVDYGYPNALYYCPERREGTLMSYLQHTRNSNPLASVGNADITTHVEFTSLAQAALQVGFTFSGFCDQHHFLVGIGESFLKSIEATLASNPTADFTQIIRTYKSLMHPSTMGMAFQFMGFQKEVPQDNLNDSLAGFRYSANPYQTLGLVE